jgi:Flp pilus assembly protein TadG
MIEFAMLAPWFVFLFIGAFDYGFYAYALIATQNAARVAAIYCSGSSSRATACADNTSATYATACQSYVIGQLSSLPNIGSSFSACTASPLVLTASTITGPEGGGSTAAKAVVAYTTTTLIPVPGLAPGSITITRTAIMRVLS